MLGGQTVSVFGDAISFTAMPLLVLALTGSGVQMGLVGILQTVPDLAFGVFAGALADRWDRRRMMLYADLGRALLTALIPLSIIAGLDTMAVILLVTAPINVLRVLFMAAFTSSMPSLVGREHVGVANGYSEAIFSVSFIIGPALAGILVSLIGAGPTLALDAVSFLVSGASLTLVRRPLQAARVRTETHLLAEIGEGIRYIAHERTLRTIVGFWGSVSVFSAPLVPAVIFYLTVDRQQASSVVGIVISAYGVGYLVGAVLAGRYSRARLGRIMLGGNVAFGVAIGALALTGSVPLMVLSAVAIGMAGALVLISYLTLRATIPPDELLGRVGSTARTISLGLSPVGLFVGGFALDLVGGGPTILSIAVLVIGISLLFASSATMRGAVARIHEPAPTP